MPFGDLRARACLTHRLRPHAPAPYTVSVPHARVPRDEKFWQQLSLCPTARPSQQRTHAWRSRGYRGGRGAPRAAAVIKAVLLACEAAKECVCSHLRAAAQGADTQLLNRCPRSSHRSTQTLSLLYSEAASGAPTPL